MNSAELHQEIMNIIVSSSPDVIHQCILAKSWLEVPFWNAIEPSQVDAHFRKAIAIDLMRKCPTPRSNLSNETLKVWLHAESLCAESNARLCPYRYEFDALNSTARNPLHTYVVGLVRNEVSKILRSAPRELTPELTGGATLSNPYGFTSAPDKISSRHTMYKTSYTARNLSHYRSTPWIRNLKEPITLCRANQYFTVPKDSRIDRACAKEASMNMPLQRAVGLVISRRLSNTGCDIPSGEARHRALAKHASLFDDYATVDCSMASDTISYELVKIILPPDWFNLLDSLRATHTLVGDKTYFLNKFSSMGNGFTFELETVIFLAIARVACRLTDSDPSECSQYGDDTILPSRAYKCLTLLYTFFGFVVNGKKSYSTGPFRESCGGDFYRGICVVTPKIKDLSDYDTCPITCIVRLHNILAPYAGIPVIDRLLSWLRKQLPYEVRRCGGPTSLGNSVLHGVPYSYTMIKPRNPPGIKGERPSPFIGIRCIIYDEGLKLGYDRWDEDSFIRICYLATFPICVLPKRTFVRIGSCAYNGTNFLPLTRVERVKR